MDSKNSFKRKMFQLVLNIITLFSGVWSGIASVASVVSSFTDALTEIDEKTADQQITIKSFTANKKKRKREMADKAFTIRGKISAFAATTGNTILLKKVKISFSKFFFTKDTTAIAFAQIILDAANDLTPAEKTAADITGAEITALSDAIQVYKDLPSPTQMRAIRKQYTSELKALIEKANNILIDSLDGLMYQFYGTEFYGQYTNVRPLHESHRHTTVVVNAVDEEGHDLEDVQVLFTSDENSFEDMTDEQGIAKQQISPDVNYTAKFILPDYEEQELEINKLHPGQHQSVKVILKKIV